MPMRSPLSRIAIILMGAVSAIAQQNPTAVTDMIRPTYVLGPGDQIVIRANEMEDISDKPFRIDADGFINLPVLGKTRASGRSVQELEADLVERLKMFVRTPQVIITVVQLR